jgi:hypothetical protein
MAIETTGSISTSSSSRTEQIRQRAVQQIREQRAEEHKFEFAQHMRFFLDNPKNKDNFQKTVIELVIAIFRSPAKEKAIVSKYMDTIRAFFRDSFRDKSEKFEPFLFYFENKLIDTAYGCIKEHETSLKDIFKECMRNFSGWVKLFFPYKVMLSLVQDKDTINKKSAGEFYKNLGIWAQEADDKNIAFREKWKRVFMNSLRFRNKNEWLLPFAKYVALFFSAEAILRGIITQSWRLFLYDSLITISYMIIGCLAFYGMKTYLRNAINKKVAHILEDTIKIDWETPPEAPHYKTVIRERTSIPFHAPLPVPAPSGHSYLTDTGRADFIKQKRNEKDEMEMSPLEEEGEEIGENKALLERDPNDLRGNRTGVFNIGDFTLAALGVPIEQREHFIKGYERGWMGGRARRHKHIPGVWPVSQKGWTAEIVPTGNLEARILATTTQELGGTYTLHFRYHQSTHDVRKWPDAPPPLADTGADVGLGLGRRK